MEKIDVEQAIGSRALLRRCRFGLFVWMTLIVIACGGGGGGGDGDSGTGGGGGGGGGGPLPMLQIMSVNFAQTHVVPATGKQWPLKSGSILDLHLVGSRPALALVDIVPTGARFPQLEGRVGALSLGNAPLLDNSNLPPSEAAGPRYSDSVRVATLPGNWMQPGLQVRVTATNTTASAWQNVRVGADTDFILWTLPFFLFGADESLIPNNPAMPPPNALAEIYAKLPMRLLSVANHPATRVDWPTLVIAPRNGNPAYVMDSAEDALSGFDPISAVLMALGRFRLATGEQFLAVQYYGALVQANADGSFRGAAGGLGGGHAGAGDHLYTGIFIHEQGHAFGLPHAGESFNDPNGDYPYVGGSLSGSMWGFDELRQLFMPTPVPASSPRFARCASDVFDGTPRQLDAMGRCIRQDPMQSGASDQAASDQYTIFADFNVASIQRYLEGETIANPDGTRSYMGGRIFPALSSPTGYRRWDSINQGWVPFDPAVDPSNGQFGINNGFPISINLPVYTLMVTLSNAGTAGTTQIYPPIGPYFGNRIRTFDPTSAADRAAMTPRVLPHANYCRPGGCDFTLRVIYANGIVRHVAIQGGFRPFFQEENPPPATASDPVHGNSFRIFAVNVPTDAALARIELLATPTVWKGMPLLPIVLAAR